MFIELTMQATSRKILVAYDMIVGMEPEQDGTTIRAGTIYAKVSENYRDIERQIEELKQKEQLKWPGINASLKQKRNFRAEDPSFANGTNGKKVITS